MKPTATMKNSQNKRVFYTFLVLAFITTTFSFASHPTFDDIDSHYLCYLRDNCTDPFCSETIINFELKKSAFVQLEVLTPIGERVRQLTARQFDSGVYTIRWDGNDELNRPVKSGVYIYRISIDTFEKTRTIALLK